MFLSTNNGTYWTKVDPGLSFNGVYSFAILGTNIYAGISGKVFTRPLSEMITIPQTLTTIPRTMITLQSGINSLTNSEDPNTLSQSWKTGTSLTTSVDYFVTKSIAIDGSFELA